MPVVAMLAVVAVVSSIPRFGQRENVGSALSDSDYYLDMATVFAGDKPAFDPTWSNAEYFGAHHYTRPLLPFLAAGVTRVVPGLSLPHAFSLVNVLAAWMLASALYGLLVRIAPGLRYPWLPPALFLTGFPQMNWGYHLLTDTLGYATAFAAALASWALLERGRWRPLAFAGLFVLQSLAFLARETGWMVPVAVGWLVVCLPRERRGFGGAVLATVLLAYLTRVLYANLAGVTSISIPFAIDVWLDPGYVLDFAVKSAVAFNLAWLLAAWGARRGGIRAVPDVIVAWGLAALAYMAAGYAHNSLAQIGYPLRLTYALFPLVFFLAARGLEANARGSRALLAALALVALNGAISVTGITLDSGESGITVPRLIQQGAPSGR